MDKDVKELSRFILGYLCIYMGFAAFVGNLKASAIVSIVFGASLLKAFYEL